MGRKGKGQAYLLLHTVQLLCRKYEYNDFEPEKIA